MHIIKTRTKKNKDWSLDSFFGKDILQELREEGVEKKEALLWWRHLSQAFEEEIETRRKKRKQRLKNPIFCESVCVIFGRRNELDVYL